MVRLKVLEKVRAFFDVRCIGRGTSRGGCGYRGGVGGYCCPRCGGMLLSKKGRRDAERLRRILEGSYG